jgi:hypothetical protein
MKKIRDRFGFRAFTSKYDDEMNYLSKLRNCLLHNYGKVDSKLPKAPLSLREGEKLSLGMPDVNSAIMLCENWCTRSTKNLNEFSAASWVYRRLDGSASGNHTYLLTPRQR